MIFLSFLFLFSQVEATLPKRPAPTHGQGNNGYDNVHCTSTKGSFTIEMHPDWAPIGASRFMDLIRDGAFDGTAIYRVVKRGDDTEAVQFGAIKDNVVRQKWETEPKLLDDPQIFSNPNFSRGMISFAGSGSNSRSMHVFITFMTGNANGTPRAPWETPFGIINEEGLIPISQFGGTGDLAFLGGNAPDMSKGYDALKESHPDIDYLGKCIIVKNGKDSSLLRSVTIHKTCLASSWWTCLGGFWFCMCVAALIIRRIIYSVRTGKSE
jgi:cyclophilin family peptidyl-prolyl cis-trans isomerase